MLIRELSTLLKSHIPLITALEILARQYPPKIKNIILLLIKDISNGAALSQAMSKYPKSFESLTIHIIKAGETSASLPQILENIAVYQEKIILLKSRFKKALFYPMTILIIAFLISLGLLIFIVPQFENLFQSMGAQLPWMTRMVLALAGFIKSYGLITLGILFLSLIIIILLIKTLPAFSRTISEFSHYFLKIPLIGNISQKLIFSRFTHTLAILLKTRIPLTEALKISSHIMPYKKYEKAIIISRENIIKGDSLSQALEKSGEFPFIFLQFIRIGEHAGCLVDMLTQIAERYETETDHILNRLILLLEPAIMLILGILIGGLVIAMYLPVFELGKIV
jgi:type IV pilus assembly protein PilC